MTDLRVGRRWTTEALLHALADQERARSVQKIAAATGIGRHQVAVGCGKLLSRGLVERNGRGFYALTATGRIAAADGARVRSGPAGRLTGRKRGRAGSLRARAWQALRRLKKATIPDLVQLAARGDERDPYSNVRRYLRELERGGFVVALRHRVPTAPPTSNGLKRYLVVKDTGPKPPVWHPARAEMFDPNTGETHACGAPADPSAETARSGA